MNPELREEYYEDGFIKAQVWYLNGNLHREDGPALIRYNKNGLIAFERWAINSKSHRDGGPAITWYNKDGSVEYQQWWFNDVLLDKKHFTSLDIIKRMKAYPLFTAIEIAQFKLKE